MVDVVDGDTIKVSLDGVTFTVRYIGIDTPETVHPSQPVQWLGPEASAANKGLVEGQSVYLERDVSETDQFGACCACTCQLSGQPKQPDWVCGAHHQRQHPVPFHRRPREAAILPIPRYASHQHRRT